MGSREGTFFCHLGGEDRNGTEGADTLAKAKAIGKHDAGIAAYEHGCKKSLHFFTTCHTPFHLFACIHICWRQSAPSHIQLQLILLPVNYNRFADLTILHKRTTSEIL